MYQPEIIYKPVYKCSACGAYVNKLDMECPYCDASFVDVDKKAGIIVDNHWADAEEHFTFGNQIRDVMENSAKTQIEMLGKAIQSMKSSLSTEQQVTITKDASTYDGAPQKLLDYNSDNIQSLIIQNIEALGLGYSLERLNQYEYDKLRLFFKRVLMRAGIPKSYGKIHEQRVMDYVMGAMIAKKQTQREFDGASPYSGRFGVAELSPYHFGLKSWKFSNRQYVSFHGDDIDWIHSGNMDGTKSNAIKVSEHAVYILSGVGEKTTMLDNKSTINAFSFELDGRKMPIHNVDFSTMINPSYGFTESYILKQNTYFATKYSIDSIDEQPYSAPCMLGVVFAEEEWFRNMNWNHSVIEYT